MIWLAACSTPPTPPARPEPPPVVVDVAPAPLWSDPDDNAESLAVTADAVYASTFNGRVLRIPFAGAPAEIAHDYDTRGGPIVVGAATFWVAAGCCSCIVPHGHFRVYRLDPQPHVVYEGDGQPTALALDGDVPVWSDWGSIQDGGLAHLHDGAIERLAGPKPTAILANRWRVTDLRLAGGTAWFVEKGDSGGQIERMVGGTVETVAKVSWAEQVAVVEGVPWWVDDDGYGNAVLWRGGTRVTSAEGYIGRFDAGPAGACWTGTAESGDVWCWHAADGKVHRTPLGIQVHEVVVAGDSAYAAAIRAGSHVIVRLPLR